MKAAYTQEAETFWPKLLLKLNHDKGVLSGLKTSLDWMKEYGERHKEWSGKEGDSSIPGVVELGSGIGHPAVEMIEKGIARKVTCFDNSETSLASSKEYIKKKGIADGKIYFINADVSLPIEYYLRKGSADTVRCVGVLEYMTDTERRRTLENARKILKSGGLLLVGSTSHPDYWQRRTAEPIILDGEGPYPDRKKSRKNRAQAWFFDHLLKANGSFVRRFDPDDRKLDSLIADYGFTIERRALTGPYYMLWATRK